MTLPKAQLAFSIPTASEAGQRRLFTYFRAHGFEGLQLKGGQYTPYLMEPEKFKGEWLAEQGAGSGLIYGGALNTDGLAALREVLSFAWAIGSERVIFCHNHPHEGVTAGNLQSFARLLSELGQEAAQAGLRLSLHHHFDQPVMLPEDMRIFFDAARPNAVGLTLDMAHLAKSGVHNIAAVIEEFAPFIDNVHLKDFSAGQFQMLGTGAINFGPIFAALRSIHYTGWLCADEESGADLAESLRVSQEFIRQGWRGAE